jgi:aspartyl-tRNA(Asn)/glutamyl-tRNA(Gln) amidotransferase subunit B
MVAAGDVSASAAKEVLGVLVAEGGDPAAIVADRGLAKAGGDELEQIVDQALADNADAVEKIKGGNPKAIGAIVGAVMKATQGRADGGEVQRIIRDRIGA